MNKLSQPNTKKGTSEIEFIALMAFLMSNVALCIDAVLPALTDIGVDLNVSDSNQLQFVVTMIFLGLGLGELFFGTLSDSFGRKPIVYIGVIIFMLASTLIVFAPNLEIFLLGRVLQGIGLSASRSVSIAIIRDTYTGDRMARIMSFIMTIFILVPMLAPLLGQVILKAYNWQAIFYFQLFFISITITWFWLRQKETLIDSKRIPFSKSLFINGLKEYFRYKKTVVYMVVSGMIQGTFVAYLGGSPKIFQIQYGMVDEFVYIFGGLALAMGFSSLINGILVVKYGMLKLVKTSLFCFVLSASTYILFFGFDANPTVAVLIAFLFIQFLSTGLVFGNLSALAMQPIGHIAGVGAAIYSFISMSLAVIVATLVGLFIENTAVPLFVGFFLVGIFSIVLIRFISKENALE